MLKFHATSEWYRAMAKIEADHDISAGFPLLDLEILKEGNVSQDISNRPAHQDEENYKIECRQAGYSRFMHMLRIDKRLSIEQLAEKLNVDHEQLFLIERKIGYKAPPRTLSLLATFYNLPLNGLLQLAGVVRDMDKKIEKDIVRFAAESDSFEKLSKEEKALLNNLVKVIRDFSFKRK